MDIVFIIIGLALVLAGANFLTEGAAAVAEKFHVSEFVIGLTIVAVGTSMPEFVVSSSAAFRGSCDMAIGNVVGSNIFNVFLILGLCALISPLPLTKNNVRFDIPLAFLASFILFAFTSDTLLGTGSVDRIGRIEGAIMFLCYIALMIYTIRTSKQDNPAGNAEPRMKMWKAAIAIAGGLVALIFGSRMFVDGASELARRMGISEAMIAITLVAGGTSLPELASSVVSIIKGQKGMALGNVLGSNIFNILFILGSCSVIRPLTLGDIDIIDILMVLLSAILPFIFAFTFRGRAINRIEGAAFLLIYAAYMWWLISKQ
ncbi:MAG TPA: calcium/sodium antiporter [Candidatus Alistipes excrementipullorum]|nr:calcium/sodium antiporter [Candidatus Alistipes excrementipullorum]